MGDVRVCVCGAKRECGTFCRECNRSPWDNVKSLEQNNDESALIKVFTAFNTYLQRQADLSNHQTEISSKHRQYISQLFKNQEEMVEMVSGLRQCVEAQNKMILTLSLCTILAFVLIFVVSFFFVVR